MSISNKLFRRQMIEAVRAGAPVLPRCPHAPPTGQCGGCAFQDRDYPAQVAAKRAALRHLWEGDLPETLLTTLDVVASPNPFAYRTRMDFVASKERFGLRRSGRFNYIIDLKECHLIPARAFAAARAMYDHAMRLGLPDYDLRAHAGFLRYVAVRRSPDDEVLLALITAAPDEAGTYAGKVEQVALAALEYDGVVGVHWLINPTRTDISFGETVRFWGRATLPMRVGAHTLDIRPNTFFQNNVWLLIPLLEAVRDAVVGRGERARALADLYGGVGTIALFVADLADQIVCVESVEESVRLARENIARAGFEHIAIVKADVADALRERTRGTFDIVIADPPRTGLGPDVCRELLRLRPQRIVYISCNPLTQRDDVRMLTEAYRLTSLRGYDMFPHTPHLESLAVLDVIR